MRSLFTGIIMLSASMAVVDAAQAQTRLQTPPAYGLMQAPIGHRQPTQSDLQPTRNDLEKIDNDNHELDLAASQGDLTGAGQILSGEDALTIRVERDNPLLDSEITDICPSCGGVEGAPPVRQRPWPIHNGFNHQPTRADLKALHRHEFTPAQAQETDQLYDQLMSTSNQMLEERPAGAP
jgi:hypothetical protein